MTDFQSGHIFFNSSCLDRGSSKRIQKGSNSADQKLLHPENESIPVYDLENSRTTCRSGEKDV
jgi:hypothetical protein